MPKQNKLTKKQRIYDYMTKSRKKKKKARDDIKKTAELTKKLLAKQAIERLKAREKEKKLEEIRKRKEKATNFDFTRSLEKINLTNQTKRFPDVDVNKILKRFKNFTAFGKRKGKKLNKFEKELMEITREPDDKKYLKMVIELLLGSGLLLTAIILLLIFMYNPKNQQNNFDNTNDITRASLSESAQNYRNNEIMKNKKKKPTHYKKNKKGETFFYNTVDEKFNIPGEKYDIIAKDFEEKNKINIENIETAGHYRSLKTITKKVMNNNKDVEKNLNKRKVNKDIEKRRILKVKNKGNLIDKMAERTVAELSKQKQTTPPRGTSVTIKTGLKPSPSSVQQVPQLLKNPSKRISKKGANLFEDVKKDLVTI